MIITCPECGTKYQYDESRLSDQGKKVKCAQCGTVFTIKPPEQTKPTDTTKVMDRSKMPGDEKLPTDKRLSLAILSGPMAGQVFPIRKRITLIGRAYGDIILNDAEISRRHCQIEVTPDGVYLEDLNSTNGTFVDGEAIQKVALDDKMEFTVGSTNIMLIISEPEI